MKDHVVRLSQALPVIWVERGGPLLEQLLHHIDDAWERSQVDVRNSYDQYLDWRFFLIATGWGNLIQHFETNPDICPPTIFIKLLLEKWTSGAISLNEWVAVLFGLELVQVGVVNTDPVFLSVPPTVRLWLAGSRPTDERAFANILQRLLPAHLAIDEDSIQWLPSSN